MPSWLPMGAGYGEGTDEPLPLPSATTVRGVGRGCHTPEPAPLPGVRGRVRRLLPGPGPLLCLGRPGLLALHSIFQEVGTPHTQGPVLGVWWPM